jgi:small subunit ribosomal protein S11
MAVKKQTKKTTTKSKDRNKNVNPMGKAYIYAGYNNTIVSITDLDGNVLCWGSSGGNNFKGSRKATPYAATIVGESTAKRAFEMGVKEVSAYMKGVGNGKTLAVKALRNGGLAISKIVDITPIAHNGCRPKKRRRG